LDRATRAIQFAPRNCARLSLRWRERHVILETF
jgi:hypothetical protein